MNESRIRVEEKLSYIYNLARTITRTIMSLFSKARYKKEWS